MGEKINGSNGKIDGQLEATGNRNGSGGSNKSAAAAAGSDNGGTAGGTGTAGGSGTGTAGGKAEKSELPKVAILDEEQKKKDEKNAKRREAYAKKKAESAAAKPKKVNTKKKKDEPLPLDADSLKGLVMTVSTLVASRPGNEHWLLSEKEVDSIITPLNKMLADSEMFKGAGQYSNQIALIVACVTIFVPRIFVSINKANEKKKREVTGNATDTTVRPEHNSGNAKSKAAAPNGGNNRPNAASSKNNANNVPFYGSPIA